MLLWDQEMAPLKPSVEGLSSENRLALAVSAIEWTVSTTTPPIETDEINSFLTRSLTLCREAVQEGQGRVHFPDELLDEYDAVDEIADEPGTSHFLSAVLACCEPEGETTTELLYGIFSFCYEGTLDRQDIAEWTIEEERNNARCLDVIRHQQELVAGAID